MAACFVSWRDVYPHNNRLNKDEDIPVYRHPGLRHDHGTYSPALYYLASDKRSDHDDC